MNSMRVDENNNPIEDLNEAYFNVNAITNK